MRNFKKGDLHLGKIVNGFLLLEDQKYILNEIIKMIKENNVETSSASSGSGRPETGSVR